MKEGGHGNATVTAPARGPHRENGSRGDIMSESPAGEILKRIAIVFLILWFIAVFTGLLGKFEYEREFLLFALVFFLLSQIPAAFSGSTPYPQKLRKLMRNPGFTLMGVWVVFMVFRWLGWFGPMDVGFDVNYMLAAGIVFIATGEVLYAMGELRISMARKKPNPPSSPRKSPSRKSPPSLYCPNCRKKVEKNWVSCPYCRFNLRGTPRVHDDDTRIY